MTANIHVGRPGLEGGIARYARAFDFVEILGEAGRHPRRPGLLEWKRVVPERFVWSIVLPASLASLEPQQNRVGLVSHLHMVADALGATWWLIRTPPSVTPSARAQRELESLVGELRGEGKRVAWEPRGLWGDENAQRVSERLGVHLVRDLTREARTDAAPVVYSRLRALGEGARIGAAAAERLAGRVADAQDCYVIVEGAGAGRVRQVLRDMAGLTNEANGADAEPDEDDEGGDEFANDEEGGEGEGDAEESE